MKYESASRAFMLDNPQADRRSALRLGQYRAGEKALWLPAFPLDRYIPYEAIECVWQRPSELHPIGCCGKGVPVVRVMVRYDDGEGHHPESCYVMDDQRQADRLIERIEQARPGIVRDNGTDEKGRTTC